jgi:hypothetical protein
MEICSGSAALIGRYHVLQLSDQSYEELEVSRYNYKDVSGLDLSHNRFKSLGTRAVVHFSVIFYM